MTSDFAYYRDLAWSPGGEWIAARKCNIVNREAQCDGSEETLVLVDPATGSQRALTVDLDGSPSVGGYPIDWSADGTTVLIAPGRFMTTEEASLRFHTNVYGIYSPASGEFHRLEPSQFPVGFGRSGNVILVEIIESGKIELAWLNLGDGTLDQLATFVPDNEFLGLLRLSPDEATLLDTDSFLPENCGKLRESALGPEIEFRPFLSLACFPSWSRDGTKLAYAAKDQPRSTPNQIMVVNADGTEPRPLFPDRPVGDLGFPTWAPDGGRIAFTQGPDGGNAIYIADVPARLRP